MSGRSTPATEALRAAGVQFSLHEYAHDPAQQSYARESSDAMGVDPGRVFKTLVVTDRRDGRTRLAVAVVPADATCDLKATGAALEVRTVEMAEPAEAQRSTGYVVGGISPFGQRQQLRTVVDEEALMWDTIFVSGGRRGLSIELSGSDLVAHTSAVVAAIAKR